MLYFLRKTINKKKFIKTSLQKSFGIGLTRSKKICSLLGLHPNCNNKNLYKRRKRYLYQFQLNYLTKIINRSYKFDYELKRVYSLAVELLKNIKCYRGFRHVMLLPTRGQRTHTNASSFRKVVLGQQSKNKIKK